MVSRIHSYPVARRVGAGAIFIAIVLFALAPAAGTAADDAAGAMPPPAWQKPFLLHNAYSIEGGGSGNSFHIDSVSLDNELLFLQPGPYTSTCLLYTSDAADE